MRSVIDKVGDEMLRRTERVRLGTPANVQKGVDVPEAVLNRRRRKHQNEASALGQHQLTELDRHLRRVVLTVEVLECVRLVEDKQVKTSLFDQRHLAAGSGVRRNPMGVARKPREVLSRTDVCLNAELRTQLL